MEESRLLAWEVQGSAHLQSGWKVIKQGSQQTWSLGGRQTTKDLVELPSVGQRFKINLFKAIPWSARHTADFLCSTADPENKVFWATPGGTDMVRLKLMP